MIGVTFFGLVFTPVFYVALRTMRGWMPRRGTPSEPALQPAE